MGGEQWMAVIAVPIVKLLNVIDMAREDKLLL